MPLSNQDNRMKVFLCHASQDKPFVRKLYQKLITEGMEPWLDEESLLPGQEWDQVIRSAIQNSDAIVVCLSNHAITKAGYVQKEIKQALDVADEQPEGSIFLIPIRIDDCQIPNRLSHLHVPPYDDHDHVKLLSSLKVSATSLGRFVPSAPPPPDVDRLMRVSFSRAFGQVFWEQFPDSLALKSKRSFTIGLVGEMATGKTSIGVVLAGRGFDLFSQRKKGVEPYEYMFRIEKNMYLTDLQPYSVDPEIWNRSLEYLQSSSDLIVFLTSSDQSLSKFDLRALAELKDQGIPLVVVANKIDLLNSTQIEKYLRRLQESSKVVPLPVSAVTGQNINLLIRFFRKGRQMYV